MSTSISNKLLLLCVVILISSCSNRRYGHLLSQSKAENHQNQEIKHLNKEAKNEMKQKEHLTLSPEPLFSVESQNIETKIVEHSEDESVPGHTIQRAISKSVDLIPPFLTKLPNKFKNHEEQDRDLNHQKAGSGGLVVAGIILFVLFFLLLNFLGVPTGRIILIFVLAVLVGIIFGVALSTL